MAGIVGQFVERERQQAEALAALRRSREELLDRLGRAYLHALESPPAEYERFGDLARLDREIHRIEDDRRLNAPVESRGLHDDLISFAGGVRWSTDRPTAEELIARNFARQIYDGSATIDLSQRYETEDPGRARRRHTRALAELEPYIEQAESLGYSVSRGRAIPVERERIGYEESINSLSLGAEA